MLPAPELRVEYLPLAELLPYARNMNAHSDGHVAELAASIKEFGWTVPVLIDKDNVLVAGHGRVLAARKLGLEQVPCIRRDHWSETQVKAYRIADNRLPKNADVDAGMLGLELLDLQAAEFDLELLGFEEAELEALLNPEVAPAEGLTDAVPENVETRCKLGDLWQVGAHRLLIGDSTNQSDVDRLFGGETAELCFTSPPYADQRQYNGGKELSTEHLATFIRTAFGKTKLFAVNLGLSRKDGAVNQYWDDYIAEANNCGLKLLSWNVWDRSYAASIGQQTAMFAIEHEWIFVFGGERQTLNLTVPNKNANQKMGGRTTNRESDDRMSGRRNEIVHEKRRLGTVIRQDIHRGEAPHPAMFPVALPEAYIEACTAPNEWVYEPFGGSGTTMIAAEKLGRRAMLMELDPKYGDVILARWEAFTGLVATLQPAEAANG